jgi:ribosomal-protein-alanine N-acetyltransferase
MEINESAFTLFPLLETPRLLLRSLQEQDQVPLFEIRSDEETMRHVGRPLMTRESDSRALCELIWQEYAQGQSLNWVLSLRDQDRLIGNILLHRIERENFRAEIGYLLHRDFWRQGLMKEAANRVINYGFSTFGLHSIYARIDPDNQASAALLEVLGFRRVACLRENFFFNGTFSDTVIYDLLQREWKGV